MLTLRPRLLLRYLLGYLLLLCLLQMLTFRPRLRSLEWLLSVLLLTLRRRRVASNILGVLVLRRRRGTPVTQIVFGIVEDLSGLVALCVRDTGVARDDGSVVEEVEQTETVAGEDDLLLGALDGGEELGCVGFFKLLTSLVLVMLVELNVGVVQDGERKGERG